LTILLGNGHQILHIHNTILIDILRNNGRRSIEVRWMCAFAS